MSDKAVEKINDFKNEYSVVNLKSLPPQRSEGNVGVLSVLIWLEFLEGPSSPEVRSCLRRSFGMYCTSKRKIRNEVR